jgi:hypothetical protein
MEYQLRQICDFWFTQRSVINLYNASGWGARSARRGTSAATEESVRRAPSIAKQGLDVFTGQASGLLQS